MKYHLARGETQLGTFSDLEVSAGLRQGRFLPSDLCWTEGMAAWQTLEAHMKDLLGDDAAEVVSAPAVTALREEVRRDRAEVRRDQAEGGSGPPASRARRLAGYVIDFVIGFTLLVAMFSLVIRTDKFKAEVAPIQEDPQAVVELMQRHLMEMSTAENPDPMLGTLSLLMVALTLTTVVLLTLRGQTLGKLLVGTHIVRNADGGRAGFVKAVLLRSLLFYIIGGMPLVGMIILIADGLMIFRQDRRCLHDLVADTKVMVRRPSRP